MVKVLGIADIIAATHLVARCVNFEIPKGTIIAFSVYLLIKAIIFLKDIGSFVDIIAGILLLLSLSSIVVPCGLLTVVAVLLVIKGILSLFA